MTTPRRQYQPIREPNVMVPMRDGVRLATDVVRPDAPRRTAITRVCADGICPGRKPGLNPKSTAYIPKYAVAMGQRRRERMTSTWFCNHHLERPMTRQNEHRDRVSKAIFDTGYNYGVIHRRTKPETSSSSPRNWPPRTTTAATPATCY